jgi:hypothetical protein
LAKVQRIIEIYFAFAEKMKKNMSVSYVKTPERTEKWNNGGLCWGWFSKVLKIRLVGAGVTPAF